MTEEAMNARLDKIVAMVRDSGGPSQPWITVAMRELAALVGELNARVRELEELHRQAEHDAQTLRWERDERSGLDE